MGTMGNPQTMGRDTSMGETEGRSGMGSTTGVGSPISNEAYNVISALANKLEGLEAYRKYSRDGSSAVWQQLSQAEVQTVSLLVGELERIVQEGKLRLQEPGRANG